MSFDDIRAAMAEAAALLDQKRDDEARERVAATIAAEEPNAIVRATQVLRQTIARFNRRRRQELTALLDATLSLGVATRREAVSLAQIAPSMDSTFGLERAMQATAAQSLRPPAKAAAAVGQDVEEEGTARFVKTMREELDLLSRHYIFQWSTFYRDAVGKSFDEALDLTSTTPIDPVADAICQCFSHHSKVIFKKGFLHLTGRNSHATQDALLKSLNGLQRFLELPIEYYTQTVTARAVLDPRGAETLRAVCSAFLYGILHGYAQIDFGDQRGSQVLPRIPGYWTHFSAFLRTRDFERLIERLEPGHLSLGLAGARPLILTLDRFVPQGEGFSLPRLGHYNPERRRLEVSLSVPNDIESKQFLDLHCYLDAAHVTREALLESSTQGVALIAAPVRPDLKDWVKATEALRTIVINTAIDGSEPASEITRDAIDTLNDQLARHRRRDGQYGLISRNYAKGFPLNSPRLTRFFRVVRKSVVNLLRTCEQDNGIRLWCSVRRSGKTTACADLGSTTGMARLVSQTCNQGDSPSDAKEAGDGFHFFEQFTDALRRGRDLHRTFFSDVVAECAGEDVSQETRFVFVLDEYETLFERMRVAARDDELRYAVVQPLLNQIVGFAQRNLVIFVGQRPDSYFILPDQNPLSPYVKQDPFPLFEHTTSPLLNSEFCEFLRKVLTSRVSFDAPFVDAVFAETAGHPFLTVNIMVEFFEWLIEGKRRANQLHFVRKDFDWFVAARLDTDAIARMTQFEFFNNMIGQSLGEYGQSKSKWLFGVFGLLREMARLGEPDLGCSRARLDDVVAELRLVEKFGWDSNYMTKTMSLSNFLRLDEERVVPRIRLLSRLAAIARPQLD